MGGTVTVEDENMESSRIFLSRKQCKRNLASDMTKLTPHTPVLISTLKGVTIDNQCSFCHLDCTFFYHTLYFCKKKKQLTYQRMV